MYVFWKSGVVVRPCPSIQVAFITQRHATGGLVTTANNLLWSYSAFYVLYLNETDDAGSEVKERNWHLSTSVLNVINWISAKKVTDPSLWRTVGRYQICRRNFTSIFRFYFISQNVAICPKTFCSRVWRSLL